MSLSWRQQGLDRWRVPFAFYTMLTSALALLGAWALKLEHPEWAAMSVWVLAQPMRGRVVEKTFARLVGSSIGVGVGALLVLSMQVSPYLLVGGLGLWLGLCSWLSHISFGFVGYATVLAGFSATMVALLNSDQPEHLWEVALSHLWTIWTGIASLIVAGIWFVIRYKTDTLRQNLAEIGARCFSHMARASALEFSETEVLLKSLADYEHSLESQGLSRGRTRDLSQQLLRIGFAWAALMFERPLWSPAEREALLNAAHALGNLDWATATQALAPHPRFATAHEAMRALDTPKGYSVLPPLPALKRTRDYIGARQASLRIVGVMWGVGVMWQATAWAPLMQALLALAVVLSVFSRPELPSLGMLYTLRGYVLGATMALVCQWVASTYLTSELAQMAAIFPCLWVGMLVAMKARPLLMVFEYHVALFLLLHFEFPCKFDLGQGLLTAVLVVSTPALAWLCYRTVFPVHLQRHQLKVARSFEQYMMKLAANPPEPHQIDDWKIGFVYRGLCLIEANGKLNFAVGQTLAMVRYFAAWAHLAILAVKLMGNSQMPDSEKDVAYHILKVLRENPVHAAAEHLRQLPRSQCPELYAALQVVLGPFGNEEF